MMVRLLPLLLPLLLALLGCAGRNPLPPTWSLSRTDGSALYAAEPVPLGALSGEAVVRQSFLVGEDGLHRVTLVLGTDGRAGSVGALVVTLLDDAGRRLHEERLAVRDVEEGQQRVLFFQEQPASALRAYTVEVRAEGVTLLAAPEDRYPGTLERGTETLAGDLLLEWGYKPTPRVLLAQASEAVARAGMPFALTALLWLLPGLAALVWLRQGDGEAWSWSFVAGAALALGGALLVLLPQATKLLGVRLGPWAVWAVLGGSVAALVVAWRRGRTLGPLLRPDGVTALYAALALLVLGSRTLALAPVAVPMWGDSVHHALITQLLLDHGGLFDDYQPFLPLAPLTYHAGFHLLCAWLGWARLPGTPEPDGATAILLGGQWQAIIAVLLVGWLAEGLARWHLPVRRAQIAGAVALLLAGLLSAMPGFYLNWGRYTQLAGQIFLPPALLWSVWAWQPGRSRRWVVALAGVVAALALTHYRVGMMYAVAVPLILPFLLRRGTLRETLLRVMASGVGTLVLIAPWYVTLLGSTIVERARAMATALPSGTGFVAEYNSWGDVTAYVERPVLVLGAVALVWLVLRRRAAGALVGGWLALLLVLSNPGALGLPGTGLVNNFMLQIALYLPLALLGGLALADGWAALAGRLSPRHGRWLSTGAAASVLALGVLGAWEQAAVAEPGRFGMQTEPDRRAAAWIAQNTPAATRFHVNGFLAYGDSVVAGVDGGWWLWLTARRATTIPPMVYAHEAATEPDYRARVTARFERLHALEADPAALAAALRAEGIGYIYIGAQGGRIGLPPGEPTLDPHLLRASPEFEMVYGDGLVWVFRVR